MRNLGLAHTQYMGLCDYNSIGVKNALNYRGRFATMDVTMAENTSIFC